MRVPVLSTDLPQSFNKVSKYIGRHWPLGKIGLNQSREVLAYLLGYNSVHEVNHVASSNVLPDTISLSKVHLSITCKALFKYGVRPDALYNVIKRTPLKELAFYAVTDVEQSRRAIEASNISNTFYYYDEHTSIGSYKSPRLFIDQHKEGFLPPYQYAVNHDGMIFSASNYESILFQLGSIEEVLAEIDTEMSVNEFIEQYISPMAWLPLEEFLANAHANEENHWETPFMVRIEHLKNDSAAQGYAVFHLGINAYYPVVCGSINAVNEVLSKLFKGEVILSDKKLDGTLETDISLRPRPFSLNSWKKIDFGNAEHFIVNGQEFIRAESFKPYPQLVSNEILNKFMETVPTLESIPAGTVEANIYLGHTTIQQGKDAALKSAITTIEAAKSDDLRKIIQYVFGNEKVLLSTVKDEDEDEDDLSIWVRVGSDVLKHHPELDGIFEIAALGYLYLSYENYVNGNRYAAKCRERDIAFIANVISTSPMLTTNDALSGDMVLTGALILATYAASSSVDLESLAINFADISSMLKLHSEQSTKITQIERYSVFLKNLNSEYLSHGEVSQPTEKSYNEQTQELMYAGRKVGMKLEFFN